MQRFTLIFLVALVALLGVQAAPIDNDMLMNREITEEHLVRDVFSLHLEKRKKGTWPVY